MRAVANDGGVNLDSRNDIVQDGGLTAGDLRRHARSILAAGVDVALHAQVLDHSPLQAVEGCHALLVPRAGLAARVEGQRAASAVERSLEVAAHLHAVGIDVARHKEVASHVGLAQAHLCG